MPKTEEELAAEAEAKKAEDQRISDLVNRAAADHVKRAMSKTAKELEERDARIAQLEAALAGAKKPEPEAKPTPAAGGDVADKRFAEMEARLAERDRKLDEERKARETEKKARLADEEKNEAIAGLTAAEVTGPLARAALLVLQDEKRIGRDEAGKVCYLEQKEGYVDKIPVADGIKKWVENEGKAYLPAKGVGGAGTKPPVGPRNGSAPKDKAAAARAAKQDLVAFFTGKTTE